MSPTTRTRRSGTTLARRLGAVLALLLLWGFAASDRAPLALTAAAHASEGDELVGKEAAGEGPGHGDYDLSALRIFNRVVLLIKDNYVDPKRIEPRKMLISALDGVERQAAEVMVDGDEKSPKIKVTVNKVAKDFDVSGVDTFWRMSFTLKDIFDFVNKNLTSRDDARDIEYAAVNGMLSTLDPHSVLLKPEYFKEMKLQTKGEFGGLGFVIQMKEGNLTVVKVLKGTPAQKAGIKSKDVITRIGNESTVNMDLNDAVNRLRGKPGTDIAIVVNRVGWPAAKPFTLTRAIINVESVESKLLEPNVGYIKLKGFQGNTARDMYAEYKRLKAAAAAKGAGAAGQLKGIVLDLRGNPGGLLDQAIQVSDAFLSEGTVVSTVGQVQANPMKEEKKAKADDNDIKLPLVVIVNSGSASASEIVAGALKNNNRAVVVGRQSFGKGSVQVLYDFPDESALKLTIAQYLTPGDVSIQEVGITPDIELIPGRVSKDKVDVFAPKKQMGEADLDKHFGNPASDKAATKRDEVVRREKPLDELRFLRDEPTAKKDAKDRFGHERPDRDDIDMEDLEGTDPDTDEIVEDYQIRFARDLVVAAPFTRRDQMLKAAKPFLEERKKLEADRIHQALEALGLNWTLPEGSGSGGGAPKLAAEMKPTATEKVAAGDTLSWTLTVSNGGTAPFKRLRAYTDSENPYLDRREFVFGTLAPGEKRAWTVNVKLPKDIVSRRDDVTFKFSDESGAKIEDYKAEINIVELPRPAFAYSWQIVDRCEKCNGDGIAQPGETVEMVVDVKNVGTGKAYDAVAVLKNKADENISLSKGRAKLGEMLPGQSKTGTFEFEVTPEFKAETAALQLSVGDETMDEYVSEKLDVPVMTGKGEAAAKVSAAAVRTSAEVPIRAAASDKAPVIARAGKGATLGLEARVGDYYRVRFGPQRTGFLPVKGMRELARAAEAKASASAIESVEMRSEPRIELNVDPTAGGIVTDGTHFLLTGQATDSSALRDMYIFVNDQKVFFKSAAEDAGNAIKFSANLPLKAGINTVLVVAREGKEFMGRRILVIHRRGTELAQQGVPAAAAAAAAGEAAKANAVPHAP